MAAAGRLELGVRKLEAGDMLGTELLLVSFRYHNDEPACLPSLSTVFLLEGASVPSEAGVLEL
jgi:hypothetical protein